MKMVLKLLLGSSIIGFGYLAYSHGAFEKLNI